MASTVGLIGVAALITLVAALTSPAAAQEQPEGFELVTDTWFGEQWYLYNWGQPVAGGAVQAELGVDVRAPEAWSVSRGQGVIVAVLDTGADLSHPDLQANLWTNPGEMGDGRESNGVDDDGNGYVDDWRGWDFVDDDNLPIEARGAGQSGELPVAHGTSLAGIIAADDDGWGMTGLAPDAEVMVVRTGFSDREALADGLRYAAANGASIVSMSFGSLIGVGPYEPLHQVMLEHPELLYVAAGMNRPIDQDVTATWPCAIPDVPSLICVAATDQSDQLAEFFAGSSGFGAETVHLGAPGDNMLVPQPPSDELFADGEGSIDDLAADEQLVAITPTINVGSDGRHDCRVTGEVMVDSGRAGALWGEWLEVDRERWTLSVGAGGFGSIQDTGGEWRGFDFSVPRLWAEAEEGFQFRVVYRLTGFADPPDVGLAMIRGLGVNCLGDDGHTERSYAYAEGTSYATPLTAAAGALVWSRFPDLDSVQVKEAILQGVHPVPSLDGRVATGGRLDAYGAIMAAAAASGVDLQPVGASASDGDGDGSGGLIGGLTLPDQPLAWPLVRGGTAVSTVDGIDGTDGDESVESGPSGEDTSTPAGSDGTQASDGDGLPWWTILLGLGPVAWLTERWRRNKSNREAVEESNRRTEEMIEQARDAWLDLYVTDKEAFDRLAPPELRRIMADAERRALSGTADGESSAGSKSIDMGQIAKLFSGALGPIITGFEGMAEELAESTEASHAAYQATYEARVQELLDQGVPPVVAETTAASEYNRNVLPRLGDQVGNVGEAIKKGTAEGIADQVNPLD